MILGVGIRFNRSSASDSVNDVNVNAIPFVNYKQQYNAAKNHKYKKIFTQRRQLPYFQHLH